MSTTDSQTQQPQTTETSQATETTTQTPEESSTQTTSGSTDLGSEETSTSEGSATDLGTLEEGEENEEAAAPPYKDYVGPPAEGKYEAFTLPDGAQADEELNESYASFAAELGLSQAGAQKLIDFYGENVVKKQLQNWGNHLNDLKSAAQSDPEIGGAKYKENLGLARKAIAKFGGPNLAKVMNQYGVGAHAEMIRAWAKVGRAIGETPALDNGGGSGATAKPLHELMYGAESVTKP